MSIQKKSLISTLKTAKKANVASKNTSDGETKGAKIASMRANTTKSMRALKGTFLKSTKFTG